MDGRTKTATLLSSHTPDDPGFEPKQNRWAGSVLAIPFHIGKA